jgi:RNA-directed DNA polymerase
MARHYNVTQEEVLNAWKSVRKAGGGYGYDNVTIEEVEKDLGNQLYKIWNRMSSGSYMAKPVLLVNIPKARGGYRQLGIPTVCDRIAQTAVKNRLEPILEDKFHKDSYAYRLGKSAIDAVAICRQRCFSQKWILEIDIKAFFDSMDHDILMDMLSKITDDKVILLYAKRFIKSTGIKRGGIKEIAREKGAPQGGVVSPMLANLYLHEAFDWWMENMHSNIKFERYADDIVVHCISEKQAYFIKDKIIGRLKQFKLELNTDKTKVVYTGIKNDHDHKKHEIRRKFSFLGYDFKPRMWREGKLVFTPGIGSGAMRMIRDKIQKTWMLKISISADLKDIAKRVNSSIRGWINYYGHFRKSELYRLAYMIDNYLAYFIKKKYKVYATWRKAWRRLSEIKVGSKELFAHWYMIGST